MDEERRDYYSFSYIDEDGTNTSLSFSIDTDKMNLYKFHDMCKRFALALTYSPEQVEEIFGETIYD